MSKFKNHSTEVIRFDYEGKEKILEPGKSYELNDENDYIQGLISFGILERKEAEPDASAKPEVKRNN